MSLRLSDNIYITTPPTDDQSSEIKTELVAPAPSSLSQYYQHQDYIQQPIQYSPFLYTGPLIHMEPLVESKETESTETSSPNQEGSSYDLYRPSAIDDPEWVDMLPPSLQTEPNYYEVKERKNKKYSGSDEKGKKSIKKESLKSKSEALPSNFEHPAISAKLTNESESVRKERDTEEENKNEKSDDSQDYESVEASAPASRLDFQMHGN